MRVLPVMIVVSSVAIAILGMSRIHPYDSSKTDARNDIAKFRMLESWLHQWREDKSKKPFMTYLREAPDMADYLDPDEPKKYLFRSAKDGCPILLTNMSKSLKNGKTVAVYEDRPGNILALTFPHGDILTIDRSELRDTPSK